MNDLNQFITSMGALAESMGVFRDVLMKSGFSREEAVSLCAEMLANLFNRNDN